MSQIRIVIVGNGISGITAARHIRKQSDHVITVISSETEHFFSRTALMYIYMGHMKYVHTKPYEDWFWKKNRINLVRDHVTSVDTERKKITLERNDSMNYDLLIVATGSRSNKFGWPGQDLQGVQGLYRYQDVALMEKNTRNIDRAFVVGGGLIGIEMVEMLRSRNIPVTFLVRESSFWNVVLPAEESDLMNRHIREHHVDLRLETELKEILSDNHGHVTGIITNKGEKIKGQFVGVTVGVTPNIDFLSDSKIETDKGVLINHFFETNIPEVYAIGDCAQFREPLPGRKSIEQVWYTGRMHGETVAETIMGKRTAYQPGIWFNSAKFFDIEYQVYGDVGNKIREGEKHLYWEHADGRHAIRFVYDADTAIIKGINLLGIRYRHEVSAHWIENNYAMDQVLANLHSANFDPEFFNLYEDHLIRMYEEASQRSLTQPTGKRGLFHPFLNKVY